MNFSFEAPGPRTAGQKAGPSSSIASDRLRKAIERNRVKQAKRDRREKPKSGPAPQMSMGSMWSKTRAGVDKAGAKATDTRTGVAKPEDTQFTTTVGRPKRATSPNINYSANRVRKRPSAAKAIKRTRKNTKKPNKIMSKFPYLFWGFCLFLLVRLIFAERGVIDYHSRVGTYERFQNDYSDLKKQNQGLLDEIKKIKSSRSYQKKLVRDHLGYISKDEFLVLFPKGS